MFFKRKSKSTKGVVFTVSSMVLASTYVIFNKVLLESLEPLTLTFISQTFSVIILLALFGALPEWKHLKKRSATELAALVVMGILAAAIAPFLFLKGLEMTSATNAALLSKMDAIALALLSALWLKEEITALQASGSIIMIIGLHILITQGHVLEFTLQRGDLLVFSAAIVWALSSAIYKKYLLKCTPEITVVATNGIGALTLFFLAPYLIGGDLDFTPILEGEIFRTLITYTLLTIVAAQFLRNKALEMLPASRISTMSLFTPIISVLIAVMLLGEELLRHHYAGGFLMIIGMIFTVMHQQQHPQHEKHERIKHHGQN